MATPRSDRRLAAVLAADVVGYARLMERDEDGTLARLKAHRRELIEPLIAEYNGRIVKLMGDGALCEFASVVDAVRCAVLIQQKIAARERQLAEDDRIRFRIGINLSDVIHEPDGDLYGDGVNVAARLEQLAEPDGVVVSGTAYDHLQGKLDLPLDFAGEQRVKNISRPVRAYRVRLNGVPTRAGRTAGRLRRRGMAVAAALFALVFAGGIWWFWPQEPRPTGKPSIAVLPFDNLGGDEGTGRLADGLTEDIITDLARFRDFDVIARNSTEVYRDKPADTRQVGRDLNVHYVLEGSVQRESDQLRITAQLVAADGGAHLWSERWDRAAADLFAVQTEIAEQVASALGSYGRLIHKAELAAGRRARPKDLTAYELYLRGKEIVHHNPPESVYEAIALYEQAIEKDPTLARAWIALSSAHDYTASFGADAETAFRASRDAAERAVELDPTDADAHLVLANALVASGDLARGSVEFDAALRLNPGAANILTMYSGWAATLGEPERGVEAAERAIRLDPNHPDWANNFYRVAYFNVGRYEDALRMVERQPAEKRTRSGWVQRAASYAALGRVDEAQQALEDALARYPQLTIQGFVSGSDWDETERQHVIQTMRKAGFPACAPPENLTRIEKPFPLPECKTGASGS